MDRWDSLPVSGLINHHFSSSFWSNNERIFNISLPKLIQTRALWIINWGGRAVGVVLVPALATIYQTSQAKQSLFHYSSKQGPFPFLWWWWTFNLDNWIRAKVFKLTIPFCGHASGFWRVTENLWFYHGSHVELNQKKLLVFRWIHEGYTH